MTCPSFFCWLDSVLVVAHSLIFSSIDDEEIQSCFWSSRLLTQLRSNSLISRSNRVMGQVENIRRVGAVQRLDRIK